MTAVFALNLRHLEAASVIARAGGISAAAPLVNLSQPALTQAIAKLEGQLGKRLFDRQPGGMVATEAGLLLAARVERALARLEEAVGRVKRGRAGPPAARLLTASQLRAVLAVSRAGSYVLAARASGVSEPSLHRAVGELEALLGADLLVRDGRAMRTTAAARRFVTPASLAVAELEAGLAELRALDAQDAGRVVIGSMPLARASLLPRAVAAFHAVQPAAQIRILEGQYGELLAGLRAGEIDFLVGALRDTVAGDDIVQEFLFEDFLYVVAAAGHMLAGQAVSGQSVTPAEAARWPWVMAAPGTPLRARWVRWFTEAGVEPPPVCVECSSVVAIRGLLLQGDWLTLLSPDQFRLERAAGLLAPIGAALPESRRQIGLTTRGDWQPTATQAAFVDVLRAISRDKTPVIE